MKNELRLLKRVAAYKLLHHYRPLKLTVGLTYQCNSKCRTCDIWRFYLDRPEQRSEELGTAAIIATLEDLADDLAWLEVTGGEPFMRPDLVEVLSFALNHTGISAVGVTSNGLLTDTILEALGRLLADVPERKHISCGISVEGVEDVHQQVRRVTGGFQRALETYKRTKSLAINHPNFRPHLCYTISRWNAGRFKEFYVQAKRDWGVSINDFSFALEHQTGFYYRETDRRFESGTDMQKLVLADVEHILEARRDERERPSSLVGVLRERFYSFYLERVPRFLRNPRQQVIPCAAGCLSAYIDPYGNVFPCAMWNRSLGSLKKSSFRNIFYSTDAEEARQLIRHHQCPNCWTPCEAQPSYIGNLERMLLASNWWTK